MTPERAVVMGLGRFGGGVGVTRWLASQGTRVHVTDRDDQNALANSIDAIRDLLDDGRVTIRTGGHTDDDLDDADLLVVNPAVPHPWDHPFLLDAKSRSIPLVTEIELLLDRVACPIVAITGTAGKSTTSALVAEGLRAGGLHVALGGNIGGSLLGTDLDVDAVVLELSSAMLHWLPGRHRFEVGVLTSYAPNHLDWHGTEAHYRDAKGKLLDWCDATILGPQVSIAEGPCPSAPLEGMTLRGTHNAWNGAIALRTCETFGTAGDPVTQAIRDFRGLPHRLQDLGLFDGVRCVNDSKSTTPEASLLAIDAYRDAPLRVIVGGYDKKIDLAPLANASDVTLYAIGQTAPALCAGAADAIECHTLDRAVARAFHDASPGDTILLSPGCASWDQFEHFEARGDAFADLVRRAHRDTAREPHA